MERHIYKLSTENQADQQQCRCSQSVPQRVILLTLTPSNLDALPRLPRVEDRCPASSSSGTSASSLNLPPVSPKNRLPCELEPDDVRGGCSSERRLSVEAVGDKRMDSARTGEVGGDKRASFLAQIRRTITGINTATTTSNRKLNSQFAFLPNREPATHYRQDQESCATGRKKDACQQGPLARDRRSGLTERR